MLFELHVGLSHDGYQSEFVTITGAKTNDIGVGDTLEFCKAGSDGLAARRLALP